MTHDNLNIKMKSNENTNSIFISCDRFIVVVVAASLFVLMMGDLFNVDEGNSDLNIECIVVKIDSIGRLIILAADRTKSGDNRTRNG